MTYRFTIRPVTLCDARGRPRFKDGKLQTRRWPPSLNARIHWRDRSFFSREFRQQAWIECKNARIPKMAKADVHLTFRSCQAIDRDNRYASGKPIIDGIVDARVIPDDDDAHITLTTTFEKVGTIAEQGLSVTITPRP